MYDTILFKKIENKELVWFRNSNSYIIMEPPSATILKKICSNESIHKIECWASSKLDVPNSTASIFVNDLVNLVTEHTNKKHIRESTAPLKTTMPHSFEFTKYYKSNDITFEVQYQTKYHKLLLHPKFIHLEINTSCNAKHYYKVYTVDEKIILNVDGLSIGGWDKKDVHYFKGKFSMQMIQHLYQKNEEEWLGALHASTICNGEKGIMLLGDSGVGKSTSLALLQASGYNCLADDFTPIDFKSQEIYQYPSAISIKENSLNKLLPLYPELRTTTKYHLKKQGKAIRYLTPQNNNKSSRVPCKALLFIYFQENSKTQLKAISKIDALNKLVPDSWISPIKKNVEVFIDWFLKTPCYELKYSNTKELLQTINNIYKYDL